MSLPLLSSEESALTELEPNFEPEPPSSPPVHLAGPARRKRQTPEEKVQKHLHNLRADNLSVAGFLQLLLRSGRPEWRNCVMKLHSSKYEDVLESLLDHHPTYILDKLEWGIPVFQEEIKRLYTHGHAFGQWTQSNMKDLNKSLNLNREDYLNEAKELSPHLTHLMRQLLTQYDTGRGKVYDAGPEEILSAMRSLDFSI